MNEMCILSMIIISWYARTSVLTTQTTNDIHKIKFYGLIKSKSLTPRDLTLNDTRLVYRKEENKFYIWYSTSSKQKILWHIQYGGAVDIKFSAQDVIHECLWFWDIVILHLQCLTSGWQYKECFHLANRGAILSLIWQSTAGTTWNESTCLG